MCSVRTLCRIAVAAILSTAGGRAALINEFVVYGQTSVNIGNDLTVTTAGSIVGSAGAVTIGNKASVQGLQGGSTLNLGNDAIIGGPVLFNSNVTIGNKAEINAGAQGGGFLSLGNDAIISNGLIFTGDITIGNKASMTGNADTGGNFVKTGNETDLGSGVITAAGSINLNGTPFSGTLTPGGTPATPASFVAPTLPGAAVFSAGGVDQGSAANNLTVTLNPGVYGDLTFGNDGILDLDALAGDFEFNSITGGNKLTIRLNNDGATTNRILVVGDLDIGNDLTWLINGAAFTVPALADASRFLLEVHGNATFGNKAQIFGTVYTPNGTLEFGNDLSIRGALISGSTLDIGNKMSADFQGFSFTADAPIPEPTTTALLGGGLAVLALLRRYIR